MTTTKKQQVSGSVPVAAHARGEADGIRLSDAGRLRLCEMAEAGATVREIAAELGIASSSVSRYAKRLGVSFDRSATDAATAARVADGRSRRAELAVRLLEQAGMELDRLSRPHRAFAFISGPTGGYVEQILPQPDPGSRLAISRTVATLLQQHVRLAEFDGDDTLDLAKSWIGQLGADLRRVAAAQEAEEAARAEG